MPFLPASQPETGNSVVLRADVSQQDDHLAVLLTPQSQFSPDNFSSTNTSAVGLSRSQRAALVAMLTPPPPPRTWTSTEELYRTIFNVHRPGTSWNRRRDPTVMRGTRPVYRTLHRDGSPFRALRPAERASLARTMRRLVERGLARPALMTCGKPMTGAWTLTEVGRAVALAFAGSRDDASNG